MPKGLGQLSEEIVDTIISDLRQRGGLRQVWDQIEDEEVIAEIRNTWMNIVRRAIEAR